MLKKVTLRDEAHASITLVTAAGRVTLLRGEPKVLELTEGEAFSVGTGVCAVEDAPAEPETASAPAPARRAKAPAAPAALEEEVTP